MIKSLGHGELMSEQTFRARPFLWRAPVAVFIAFLLMLVFAQTAKAQTVRGVVNDAFQVRIPGAVVQLLDSTSVAVARALSNERGEFVLIARSPGTYRLRTLRIGFSPSMTPVFVVARNEVLVHNIVINSTALSLDTIRVSQRMVCRVSKDTTAAAFAVWDQARTALTAVSLNSSDTSIVSTVAFFERVMEPSSERVLRQSIRTRTDTATQLWHSASIDSLHNVGYVVVGVGDTATYYAPSLEMLASDQFTSDHCFRIVASSDTSRLGISFEPSPDRSRISEIAGTLWLDRRTTELRAADFHFVNAKRAVGSSYAGGTMMFVRMANGASAIVRWSIQMPVMTQHQMAQIKGQPQIRTLSNPELSALQEVGGELAMARRRTDTLWTHPPFVLSGTVVDSVTDKPVVGALLSLLGTEARSVSDTGGQFALSGALPGEYTLDVNTISLDSVHAVQRMAVAVIGNAKPVRIRVASAQDIAAIMCQSPGAKQKERLHGILMGTTIAPGDTAPRIGVNVTAEWIESPKNESKGLVTKTDRNGNFLFCGVPIDAPVTLRARDVAIEAAPLDVTIQPGGRLGVAALTLDPTLRMTALFSGIVVDTAGQPIQGVELALPKLDKHAVTGEAGTFRLRDIPSGKQKFSIRKIGWSPLDTVLEFSAHETLDRRIVLDRVTTLSTVQTTADAPWMRGFEANRKLGIGHFVTADQIDRQHAAETSQLVSATSGMRLFGNGSQKYVGINRGPSTLGGRQCGATRLADVYLDNMRVYSGRPGEEPFDINSIDPKVIGGMEFYASAAETPSQYQNLNTVCGVVVIWTRR